MGGGGRVKEEEGRKYLMEKGRGKGGGEGTGILQSKGHHDTLESAYGSWTSKSGFVNILFSDEDLVIPAVTIHEG